MNQLNYKHIAEKLKKIKWAYLLSFLFFTASAYYTFELIRTGASMRDESGFVAIYFAIVMIWSPLTLCSLGLNIRYIYKENRRLFRVILVLNILNALALFAGLYWVLDHFMKI